MLTNTYINKSENKCINKLKKINKCGQKCNYTYLRKYRKT